MNANLHCQHETKDLGLQGQRPKVFDETDHIGCKHIYSKGLSKETTTKQYDNTVCDIPRT